MLFFWQFRFLLLILAVPASAAIAQRPGFMHPETH